MTPMEKMHLYFSHCISEDKLMHVSKNKVPGIPPGLKRMAFHVRFASTPKLSAGKPRRQPQAVMLTTSVLI